MTAAETSLAELEIGRRQRLPGSAPRSRRRPGGWSAGSGPSLEYRSGAELEDDLGTVLTTLQRAVDNAHVAVDEVLLPPG